MTQKLTCPGCQATLQLRPEYAGKKIRCPKCTEVIAVPVAAEEEDAVEVMPVDAEAITDSRPGRETKSEVPRKRRREEEEEDYEDDRDDHPNYVPCPRCGGRGATRVLWTPWGSFYGPALFTHVRCPKCYTAYNGNTGRSNLVPAIVFVTIPAILLLGIVGFVIWMLMSYA